MHNSDIIRFRKWHDYFLNIEGNFLRNSRGKNLIVKYWVFIPYRNKTRISTLIISKQHHNGGSIQGNRHENETKYVNIKEEEIELSSFTYNSVIYIEKTFQVAQW